MSFIVIIGSLVIVGVILRLLHRDAPVEKRQGEIITDGMEVENDNDENEVCCGLHEICSKSAQRADRIIYFDDEELDRFKDRSESDMTAEDIEEFRDVLLTLPYDEITLWQESLVARGITVPQIIRDEMIILLEDVATTVSEKKTK